MAMEVLCSLSLEFPISGLSGANGRLIAVDGPGRRIHSIVAADGSLAHVATVESNGSRPWRRVFPILEHALDYMIMDRPSCVMTDAGDLCALATPDAPIQLFDVPGLELVGELGAPGEANDLCFAGDQPNLIANRLAVSFPAWELSGEAYWFDRPTGSRHLAREDLIGYNIVSSSTNCLFTLRQEVESFVHETSPPFRTRDFRFHFYVRPDGTAISRSGRYLAVVDFDYFHRLIVLDTAYCRRKLSMRYAGETNRPGHALNLGLAGFDAADGIYVPAPKGAIVRFDLTDGHREDFQAHAAEITGLVTFPDQNLLVSSDAEGMITLWHCDVPQITMPDIPNQLASIPFVIDDHFTRMIDLGDEPFAFAP